MKQIDWALESGGEGFVKSFRINNVELLDAPVYPSDAYVTANYPHCEDLFNIFPPFGNGIIGANGRHSIVDVVTRNTLPVDLEIVWEGPHGFRPMCSMGGISYAGYAKINVYIEAQDNAGMHFCSNTPAKLAVLMATLW